MSKYTKAQAAGKARQIHERFSARIAEACAGSLVPVDFLGGFVGVEAGVDHAGHISETATRFEPGVFHHLQLVRDGLAHSWSHVTTADLKDSTDDALRNLATSYGLTQIMGWHMIHDLPGSIADLRDPEKHLGYAVQLLQIVAGPYLRKKNFEAVLHIWNSGTPTGRTYDPDYVHNALAVMAAYGQLTDQEPNDPAAAGTLPAAGGGDVAVDPPAEQPVIGGSAQEAQPPPVTTTVEKKTVEDDGASRTVTTETQTPTVNVTKEGPSTFVKIGAAVTAAIGFITNVGINIGTLFDRATEGITGKQVAGLVAGAGLVALAIWLYDRSAQRANALNRAKIAAAADRGLNTVELKG